MKTMPNPSVLEEQLADKVAAELKAGRFRAALSTLNNGSVSLSQMTGRDPVATRQMVILYLRGGF